MGLSREVPAYVFARIGVADFGTWDDGSGVAVSVPYVSANKPMTCPGLAPGVDGHGDP